MIWLGLSIGTDSSRRILVLAWVCLSVSSAAWGQDSAPAPERIDPAGIRGALVICGGGRLPLAARERFLKLAGGPKAKLVVIPTARDDQDLANADKGLKSWEEDKPESLAMIHTRSREDADLEATYGPLKEATGVWFDGGSQSRLADAYLGTAVERELQAVLQRGGVIGGTSAGAAIMCRVMIAQGNPVAEIKTGFDFLPGCVIDQHFTERKRKPRLLGVLAKHPLLFGMGIDEGTAVIVQGREMDVVGSGQATICLRQSATRTVREIPFKSGEQTDLTRWRLAALARTQASFPPVQLPPPKVPQGSLVIVGGGGMTPEIVNRFIELAGGPESTIVVLPTANPDPLPDPPRDGKFLERAGCKRVVTFSGRTQAEVTSAEFLTTMKEARGVWFGGGRQWRFMDAYARTAAADAIHDVLRRGGVIGGSSAGATIQGDYLLRGSPQGNFEMMAEGYERGMAFLPGTAIDQHFTQRKRLPDMLQVMQIYPQLLGIGLDETTAIIVRGQIAEVMGKHQAHFFDGRYQSPDEDAVRVSLDAGQRYDLVERKVVEASSAKLSP